MKKIHLKTSKKLTAFLMAVIMTLSGFAGLAPQAEAYMWPCGNTASMSIKTYPLDENIRSIPAYQTSSLSGARVGTVYGTDLVTITAASGNAVKVRFETARGTKEGWIDAAYLSKGGLNTGYSLAMKAGAKVTVYRYETGSATIGSISKNDVVYLVYAGADHSNGRVQFIYPISGSNQWKMGWCSFSDVGGSNFRAVGGGHTINDGIYRIKVSGSHSLDGQGPDNNTHVWQNLDVPQQKVRITHLGNGIYQLAFLSNGYLLDQQYASMDPSTLIAHPDNGGDNQKWYIADLGSGRFGIFNKKSGLSLDVYCYRTTTNAADILAYWYNGQAVTLEKLDGGNIKTSGGAAQAEPPASSVSSRQQSMANAALSMLGSTDYNGYCQKFVRIVGCKAGLPNASASDALTACSKWRVSTSMNDIPVGAAVYLRSKNTSSAGYKYGHVGVYVGDGYVVHAQATVKKQTLSSMLSSYNYLGWGWQAGVDLR